MNDKPMIWPPFAANRAPEGAQWYHYRPRKKGSKNPKDWRFRVMRCDNLGKRYDLDLHLERELSVYAYGIHEKAFEDMHLYPEPVKVMLRTVAYAGQHNTPRKRRLRSIKGQPWNQ